LILNNILGFSGYLLRGIAATISIFIAMNAALGSSVSIMFALARDHYIPKHFLKVSKKTNTPTLIIIVNTTIAIFFTVLAIAFANIGFTANITTFIYFFGLAFINFAVVILRYKRKELDRPFKAPLFPYLPIIVGIICLILSFVLNPNAVLIGLIILFIGITYYLLTIADRHSIILTIAGLKFFAIILVGVFIWLLNNFGLITPIGAISVIFSNILLRILIFLCIFGLATLFLDIFPLKELIFFFIKKVNKKEVAIDIGIGQIIELKKSKTKLIYTINIIISIIQIFGSIFIFILVSLFAIDVITIDNLSFGSIVMPQVPAEYLFNAIIIFFGITLFFGGLFSLYLNRETKTLGI
ncbi:MAG: amino acid permease, partial [Promethearchaeota archaeon]